MRYLARPSSKPLNKPLPENCWAMKYSEGMDSSDRVTSLNRNVQKFVKYEFFKSLRLGRRNGLRRSSTRQSPRKARKAKANRSPVPEAADGPAAN